MRLEHRVINTLEELKVICKYTNSVQITYTNVFSHLRSRDRKLQIFSKPELNITPLCIAAKPSMYADDHQIYQSGHDLEEVSSQLSVSADQATKWYESNLLAANLKKY